MLFVVNMYLSCIKNIVPNIKNKLNYIYHSYIHLIIFYNNFSVLQANTKYTNISNANIFVEHTKSYLANIWTSNLNLQISNDNEFFVVNNVTASKFLNKKSIELIIKNENSIQIIKKLIKVRLTINKVKLY